MIRPGAWGVDEGFHLVDGRWQPAPPETVAAILEAMGAHGGDPPGDGPIFVRDGVPSRHPGPGRLVTEAGAEFQVAADTWPAGLPLGYHTFTGDHDGSSRLVVVSPRACRLPHGRAWGWAVQLYAVRSAASWGIGDLGDLRRLASWSRGELGAGLLLLNPLHASLPALPQTASPYFPSSRRFRNPLYLRVEDMPGAAELGGELAGLAQAGRRLNADRRIDRDAVYRLKSEAFERLFDRFTGDAGFDEFRASEGADLEWYGTFCVLDEQLGRPWTEWPERFRHPGNEAVAAFARKHERRVGFHAWLQWHLVRQLEPAAGEVALVHDLAVGVDPAGADAWLGQDVMALGMSVGAPPDEFNTRGQDWGLPPFDPWKLRAAGYEPFIRMVRAAMAPAAGRRGPGAAGGVRLDHVMGLFRLYWMPRGGDPSAGTYVRYPAADLLDIVALESWRTGSFVVGEDLGTVEPSVRAELASRKVLSYKLLWFEAAPPPEWPEEALAAVTTHDLPTVAGLWSGSDVEAQRSIGLEPNEDALAGTRRHLQEVTGVAEDAPPEEAVAGAYAALGSSPCLLLTATLDDALGVEERPNMPGTLDEWPNWSIALPAPLEAIEGDDRLRRLARRLARE